MGLLYGVSVNLGQLNFLATAGAPIAINVIRSKLLDHSKALLYSPLRAAVLQVAL